MLVAVEAASPAIGGRGRHGGTRGPIAAVLGGELDNDKNLNVEATSSAAPRCFL
jgi:hypothetical protein